ncbi:MAG: cytochrome c biogenesis protein CcsA [Cyclobacteriaceae bacterium]|nr:cytochrome c biogenesis protein CcsA [Cyclobacteriaceae bacterium]
MMHYLIGNIGHLFVILSFVAAIVSAFAYAQAQYASARLQTDWLVNARVAFYVHAVSVLGAGVSLFIIIYNHYFEYHYAYSHSDKNLPLHYLISTFWNGQEGSFWLWMFWQAVLGIILMKTQKSWEAPAMVVFALVQAFLASMILGSVIPGIDLKIGSSPFILLRDALDDPIFKMNPDFVPADGNGLNPLLQNYWMVIHPPTLFLGFASTLVPFAFCLAGLWQRQYTEWVRPALPWALFSAAILGLGILMGGYWAYETLNFGGYWNWDPVENAVYVPWLVLVASVHTMITYKNSKTALKASVILVVAVFLLILYSTFLVRSGILGDTSVHSFTDLGLSGQLLIYQFFFTGIAVWLIVRSWKEIPTTEEEVSTYSREFWIFMGASTLCLMGLQVLIPTSIPVYNSIVEGLGVTSNVAPPADQVGFYSKFQLWFAAGVALLSGTGQFFWWKRMDRGNVLNDLLLPVLLSLLVAVVTASVSKVYNVAYGLLLFAGVYIILSNIIVAGKVLKKNPSLSGGALAHMGVGLMLIGILFSSGYSKVVSLNNSGLLISKQFSDTGNREHLLLYLHEPELMAGYELEYLGERLELRDKVGYIKRSEVEILGQPGGGKSPTEPLDAIAQNDILKDGKKLYARGDTLRVHPENIYYEIEMRKNGKVEATLFPRLQVNPNMGLLASPDIKRAIGKDLYVHSAPLVRDTIVWSEMQQVRVRKSQEFFVNDYVAMLEDISRVETVAGVELTSSDAAVQARIRVEGERGSYFAQPVFIILNSAQVGRIYDEIADLGVRLTLLNIHPETEEFTLGVETRQKDWVVIKAMEKPLINILWLGTGVLMIGFSIAMVRRFKDFRKGH